MTWLALLLDVVFLLVAFGARTIVQRRRTGDSGWRLGRPHSAAEAAARALMVGAGALLGVGLAVRGADAGAGQAVAGAFVAVGAIALVTVAQLQMGASWRIGVDPEERTALIVDGLYARLRNPIYTGMVAFAVGQALLVPSAAAVAAVVAMAVGVEIQVRAVEEPYLAAIHVADFDRWRRRSGRFLPTVAIHQSDLM